MDAHSVSETLDASGSREPGFVAWGSISVDLIGGCATFSGRTIELQPLQLRILAYLIANAGAVVPAAVLRERVLRIKAYRSDSGIARQICALRQHLGKGLITTVRGGYGIGIIK